MSHPLDVRTDATPQRELQIKPSGRISATLSLSGLFASFGCAACCALPIMLASIGLAGAWTLRLQLLVGPYEQWWLWGTILLIGLGAGFWMRDFRRAASRGSAGVPMLTCAVIPIILVLGVLLLGSTLMVEHAG